MVKDGNNFMILFFRTCLILLTIFIYSCARQSNEDVTKIKLSAKKADVNELSEIKDFLKKLKTAVKKNDSKWISESVHYPWNVYIVKPTKKTIPLRGPDDFLNNYSEIFTPNLKKEILRENENNLKLDERTGSSVILGSGYMTLLYVYKDRTVKILGFFPN